MVVGARRTGLSISQTADLLGRKCLVDVRGQRRMDRLVRDDRKATVTQIITHYNQDLQNTISEHTTRRTLKQMISSSRRPHRVPLLSDKNSTRRIQFTQDHQNEFLEHDNEFTLLKCSPQSPDLNPIEHLWDVVEREILIMDVQTTNLQQLCDAIMTIWTKISEECFQHLVEFMPRRINAVLKTKWGPTRY